MTLFLTPDPFSHPTAYDTMPIARIKGERREVRRRIAAKSKALLNDYRQGRPTNARTCPLQKALAHSSKPTPQQLSPQQGKLGI